MVFSKFFSSHNFDDIPTKRRGAYKIENLNTTLTLFFTGDVGLETWAEVGNLEREIPIWLKKHFDKKLIVGCGHLCSHFVKNQSKDKEIISDAIQLETNTFPAQT